MNFEVEKEIFVECEKYLHDKINVKELIKHPQKIYIFYNILNRMANVIDTKYFELCKKRVMSDLIFRYDRKNPRLLFSSRSTLTIHI